MISDIREASMKPHHVMRAGMGWQPMPRLSKGVEEEVD